MVKINEKGVWISLLPYSWNNYIDVILLAEYFALWSQGMSLYGLCGYKTE